MIIINITHAEIKLTLLAYIYITFLKWNSVNIRTGLSGPNGGSRYVGHYKKLLIDWLE